ncbi:hypothetical protein RIN60_04310 [Kluyvera cryocrescens]|uniref:hypothetical protein n=1 Tax=Kluyvera cryocrescens TaxID=580 RepID=UPI0028BEDA13|nr:hypothetical protein [Kluyvera cryocrescens]MEB7713814.1 hypothetical protein [Kluyvera cryocrescens]WNN72596.1 hypothetical protein RIN60_04310 [Kluyvera cryocrescens]HDG1671651.1 hypothetical protein [Kluyvera cryocrescens]HEP1897993.1 hypothetical protein [Kluyvera cryocrescens]
MANEERPDNQQPNTNESTQQVSFTANHISITETEPKLNAALDNAETLPSFADQLYDKITSVIGGNNPNQFFCMSLPGMQIDKNLYSYDIENNQPKPPLVEANESKLVNRLFDACKMTGSDNGRHLQTQYKSALDMLTPQLNGKLFDAKSKLRKVLMTPYPYNFGEGLTTGFTLQQVFYRLYGDYVDAKQVWAKVQLEKKIELDAKYPGETKDSNRNKQNDYLDWYETTAESQLLKVQEKLGKVLNVFSPGDMEIITGILDSGAGREIAEARQTLANVQKLNPDGGYVYPVTLYPENWFNLLDTSFTPIDLLESPTALAQQLSVLMVQRSNLAMTIDSFLNILPDPAMLTDLKAKQENAEKALQEAKDAVAKVYSDITSDTLKLVIDIIGRSNDKDKGTALAGTTSRILNIDPDKAKNIITALAGNASRCMKAQDDLIAAAQNATDRALEYFQQKNLLQYKQMLLPLQTQLARTESDIADIRQQIGLSTVMQQANKPKDGSDVTPNVVPDRFAQVLIESTMASVRQSSSNATSASASSSHSSFFFGGYSSSRSHRESVDSSQSETSNIKIQIGMSIAKVGIGREWFNPGVFLLTKDMYNTSSKKISPNSKGKPFQKERFDAMNDCAFPCFPVAFIIARDVTIKFSSDTSMSNSFAQSVEDHSSSGGGFFIFGGNSSSSSNSSRSNSCATSSANSVTVRFTSPQILGYYLEATPADESVTLSEVRSGNSDYISILDFIKNFQIMLDDYNSTYNRDALQMSPRSNRATD